MHHSGIRLFAVLLFVDLISAIPNARPRNLDLRSINNQNIDLNNFNPRDVGLENLSLEELAALDPRNLNLDPRAQPCDSLLSLFAFFAGLFPYSGFPLNLTAINQADPTRNYSVVAQAPKNYAFAFPPVTQSPVPAGVLGGTSGIPGSLLGLATEGAEGFTLQKGSLNDAKKNYCGFMLTPGGFNYDLYCDIPQPPASNTDGRVDVPNLKWSFGAICLGSQPLPVYTLNVVDPAAQNTNGQCKFLVFLTQLGCD